MASASRPRPRRPRNSRRPLWCLTVSSSLLVATPVLLQAQNAAAPQAPAPQAQGQQDPAQLWSDFNHYVLIARPDLAAAAAERLNAVELPALLAAVEGNEQYKNYQSTLERAQRIEELEGPARQLETRIQQARFEVARAPERIGKDIEQLPEGGRPYRNAVARLREAGQFAAPQLVATLVDPGKARLHPYVMSAAVAVGQPVARPLAVALPKLPPAQQAQIAQVLAEIGYPLPALPYLKMVLENQQTDPGARSAVERAYNILLDRSDLPRDLSAAELFLVAGEGYYTQGSRGETVAGYDRGQDAGILWEYDVRTGLVPVPVPGPIYADALAMKAARQALQLQPNLDQALSLYLMANLRRENRLPEGAQDPSYGDTMQPAPFYAMLAGPVRQHDVLARALRDMDAALALDAIDALGKTAGTNALIGQGGAQQPLLRALSFPDRLVRFRAAQALANARPESEFPGAERVVPVLSEAIRPGSTRYALVLASTQERANELLANVGDQGYEAFGGTDLGAARGDINARPAVDLVVIDLDAERTGALLRETQADYKLGTVPIVAVVGNDRMLTLNETFANETRLTVTAETGDAQTLGSAIEQALAATGAAEQSEEQRLALAVEALDELYEVGIGRSVYDVAVAEPALVAALQDDRDEVVTKAGQVLALIGTPTAQEALGRAAIETGGEVQVSLLDSLGVSASHHGNKLPEVLTNDLLKLVQESTGETAIAAARAHGALSLPTSNAVQLIATTGAPAPAAR